MSDENPVPSDQSRRNPAPHVVDQRQQQIDPARERTADPNERPMTNTKQPGEPGAVED